MTPHDLPAACENCAAPLHGHYCHACGQSVVNPVRDVRHALEEVFESFWHLDGRVFRTLRELAVPGRVARNYLAGQRVRYIAPLRLFLILSLLTFFVGRLLLGSADLTGDVSADNPAIAAATTEAEVVRLRDTALAEIERSRANATDSAASQAILTATGAAIRESAESRLSQLRGARASGQPPPAAVESRLRFNGQPWHPQSNPARLDALPEWANEWLNHKIGRAQTNVQRMAGDPAAILQAALAAVPSVLFVLMPLLALLLKLVYLGSGRLYLEHLVVALYSHIWLLLTLLAIFVLAALGEAARVALPWLATTLDFVKGLLMVWTPLYLLLMQKRVYGERWLPTTIKYLFVGSVYFFLVGIGATYAILAGLVGG